MAEVASCSAARAAAAAASRESRAIRRETIIRIKEIRHQKRVFVLVFVTVAITASRSSPVQPGACSSKAAAVDRRASGGIVATVPDARRRGAAFRLLSLSTRGFAVFIESSFPSGKDRLLS
jgi:hypothetical protein